MKNIARIAAWSVSSLVGFVLFMPIINFLMLVIRVLQSINRAAAQLGFFKLAFGFPSFALLALSWPIFIIYCYHYYKDSTNLKADFLKLISIELYLFPLLTVIYRLTFPQQLTSSVWIIAGVGLILGTLTFGGYKYTTN